LEASVIFFTVNALQLTHHNFTEFHYKDLSGPVKCFIYKVLLYTKLEKQK